MAEMNATELQAFLEREFPQGVGMVEQAGDMRSRMRLPIDDSHLRPGGTVSGPTMMALADCAFYIAVLAEIGPVALAVTTNLNINFYRKPEPTELIAEARIFKLGQRLAVGDVMLYSKGQEASVAHVTCTYAIPPRD
jgi:uncharacterized protein (TIGR00369 family)